MERKIEYQFFSSWPYDEALQWMMDARAKVRKDKTRVILGCGSHREIVITLGRNNKVNEIYSECLKPGVIIRQIDRGGGATAHEPGQLVLYPVFNIEQFRLTIPCLVSLMENVIVHFLLALGVVGNRSSLGPGIYVDKKKIGFIGMRIRDHIISHGLAINVKNDGTIFSSIMPCGIPSLRITSLQNLVPVDNPLEFYMKLLAEKFAENLYMNFGA